MNSAPEAATTNKNDCAGAEVAVETITEGQVAWFGHPRPGRKRPRRKP